MMPVRLATTHDAEEIATLHIAAWRAAYDGLMPREYLAELDVVDRTEKWRARLSRTRDDEPVIVAEVEGRVAGFAVYGACRDAPDDGGELHALNVHPAHWRAGVGSALLNATHEGLIRLQFTRAILWVIPGNTRARRFYESHGWIDDKIERTDVVQGVTVPEVRYRRALA
jgi:GNAT superfamily N-acetyltransferase